MTVSPPTDWSLNEPSPAVRHADPLDTTELATDGPSGEDDALAMESLAHKKVPTQGQSSASP